MARAEVPVFVLPGYQGRLGFELPDCEEQLFQIHSLPILDIDEFKKICGVEDCEAFLAEILDIFLKSLPQEKAIIEIAHNAHNWKQIEKIAHKMKGGCVCSGLGKLSVACQFLERYIKAGYTNESEHLYQQMLEVMNETAYEVQKWIINH